MPRREEHITAIEIGTSAIKVCMGLINEETVVELLGYHETPTRDCVRKGEIVSTNAVLEQLTAALNTLEEQTHRTVEKVFLAVTGDHFRSINITGTIPVTSPDRVITDLEIIEATRNARQFQLPPDQFWVASFQRLFVIDGKHRAARPLGMVGSSLSADLHMIYCNHNRLETLLRLVCSVMGQQVSDIIFSGIASYYGMEQSKSLESGVLMIDIGRGITEYALFHDGGCMHTGQLTVGTDHLANDLALGLRLPLDLSRELIIQHGSALLRADEVLRMIPAPDHIDTSRVLPEGCIHRIMELRLQETLEIIRDDIDRHNLRHLLNHGVMLGGGGALIPNLPQLVQRVFRVPAAIAAPRKLTGLDPSLQTPRILTPLGLLFVAQRLCQIQSKPQPLRKVVQQEVSRITDLISQAFRI